VASRREIVDQIGDIARENLDLTGDVSDIGPATLLMKGGLDLDSFALVELISQLEARFSFEFRESDFREEHFESIGALGALVHRYVEE
jgi:acyl carrier protein